MRESVLAELIRRRDWTLASSIAARHELDQGEVVIALRRLAAEGMARRELHDEGGRLAARWKAIPVTTPAVEPGAV